MLKLKDRNKIYLFIKNLKIKNKNKKLDHIKVEPFFIKNKKKTVSYKLKLPKNAKVYLLFNMLLLESTNFKYLYNIYFIIKCKT